MEPSVKLSRLRAELEVNRQDAQSNLEAYEHATGLIAKIMQRIKEDPAHAHRNYCMLGLTYVERDRHLTKAEAAYKYCLTLREQIRTLSKE